MPTARKITSINAAPKWSPSTPLPSSQPGRWDPQCCLFWHLYTVSSHTQTPETEEFQKGPPIREWLGRKVTGRISCLTVACFHCLCGFTYHLPGLIQILRAMPGHKDLFYFLESTECLRCSQQATSMRCFLTRPLSPCLEGPLSPKIRSSPQKRNRIRRFTAQRLDSEPLSLKWLAPQKFLCSKWE